jgi:hypothetical protein
MGIPEMIGWISLGFAPMYVVLKLGSSQLARRIPAKPLLNLRSEKKNA